MAFQDKTLTCSDCGTQFTFSAAEQEFFRSKGYTNEPKRCPTCRQARKAERTGASGGMKQRQMYPQPVPNAARIRKYLLSPGKADQFIARTALAKCGLTAN